MNHVYNDKCHIISFQINSNSVYPTEEYNYSPSERYPEYRFADISPVDNTVYPLVRSTLSDLGLDIENYGKSTWNPIGCLLQPGQTVVIKPNLVMHENENIQTGSMDCLVTHPSCLRPVIDYCIIALTGTDGKFKGKIVIADAPMQGCRFDVLISKIHLDRLLSYYKDKRIDIALVDLRQYESVFDRNKVIIEKKYTDSRGVIVHLGDKSMHCLSSGNREYRVSDYDKDETMIFHNSRTHDYEIAEEILKADFIINFCKPKTHRLAGFTAAQKNLVGIAYNKASLPHRKAGSTEEGGDAYLHRNCFKRLADNCLTIKAKAENKNNVPAALIMRYCYGFFLVLGRMAGKDKYYIGSWYGNDTIWRTILDLNYIIKYSDKDGEIKKEPQRNVLHLADMIIAGQRNGPVKPDPKPLGIIGASFNGALLDFAVCKIMGFNPKKIPLLRAIMHNETFIQYSDPKIVSNDNKYSGNMSRVSFPDIWKFIPHDAWAEELSSEKR